MRVNLRLDDPLAQAIRDQTNGVGAGTVICRVDGKEFRLNQWSISRGECRHDDTVTFETAWDGPEVAERLLSQCRRTTRWKYRFARLLRDLGHDLPRLPRWR